MSWRWSRSLALAAVLLVGAGAEAATQRAEDSVASSGAGAAFDWSLHGAVQTRLSLFPTAAEPWLPELRRLRLVLRGRSADDAVRLGVQVNATPVSQELLDAFVDVRVLRAGRARAAATGAGAGCGADGFPRQLDPARAGRRYHLVPTPELQLQADAGWGRSDGVHGVRHRPFVRAQLTLVF